jgi:hypothetical protein
MPIAAPAVLHIDSAISNRWQGEHAHVPTADVHDASVHANIACMVPCAQLPCVQAGRLQRRYKRFLADVVFEDSSSTAPLPHEPCAAPEATAAAVTVATAAVATTGRGRSKRAAAAVVAAVAADATAPQGAANGPVFTTVHCPNTG